MADIIRGVRGMHDALPEQTPQWQFLEETAQDILQRYGYREIRTPIVERTELFERSIGETTDIVSKEMYTFEDRSGDRLTLRPEGTAGCVRAGIETGLFAPGNAQRIWYKGPMFRHEKPQKGRFRQFYQIGAEAFGLPGPDIDAELILLSARLWRALGINEVVLELNTLGSNESRQAYRQVLVSYFSDHAPQLDQDSRQRLHRNPLRILDSKNPDMRSLIEDAPGMDDHLDQASIAHFGQLKSLLDDAGIPYRVNPRLVRGLDYYNGTVFEWTSGKLGAQGAICAGGRYDGLVEHFGGRPVPAVGFAMGMERILELMSEAQLPDPSPHVYIVSGTPETLNQALSLAEDLRDRLPALRVLTHCGGGSFRAQFKKADRSGAAYAVIVGEEELKAGNVGLKSLRQDAEQENLPRDRLAEELSHRLGL